MDVLAESWTLEKIQSIPFDWKSILSENEVPVESSRYGQFYGQEEQYSYSVPTLRQYYETFRGKDIVHDTEIKSINPESLPVYKALTDACQMRFHHNEPQDQLRFILRVFLSLMEPSGMDFL